MKKSHILPTDAQRRFGQRRTINLILTLLDFPIITY